MRVSCWEDLSNLSLATISLLRCLEALTNTATFSCLIDEQRDRHVSSATKSVTKSFGLSLSSWCRLRHIVADRDESQLDDDTGDHLSSITLLS